MNTFDSLKKLAAYVPAPVAQAIYERPVPLTEPQFRRLSAAMLFADISGFTPLSEILSASGSTGAEELTHLINQYFTRLIRIIENHHGQVVKFSGDAVTVMFPNKEISLQTAARQAGECALTIQAKMSHFSNIKTSRGRASLGLKVGIGLGQVLECSIGGVLDRWEYVVGGEPLVQVTAAESLAQPGQIVLSPQAWQQLEPFFKGNVLDHNRGFVTLKEVTQPLSLGPPVPLDWSRLDPSARKQAEQALLCYIPGAIKARLKAHADWLAELRRITILFIGVGGFDYDADEAGPQVQNFLQAVQEVIYRYEGSLGKVAIDDKGTVLLVLFGVPPLFHEDDSSRAVACALGLQSVAQEQHLRMAIGITEGSIFAGPVGAPNQREYTVIGNDVNLASRLMEYGWAGSIIISERVKNKAGSQFILEQLGQLSLRGNTELLSAYQVKGEQGVQDKILNRYLMYGDRMIGRKAELEQMRRMAARARAGAGQLLLLEGEPGVGKSRLVAELLREWMMEGGVAYGSKCISYGQQIPYQSWREVLIAIFGLTPSLSIKQKLDHLETGIKTLEPQPDQPSYWLDRLPLLADVLGIAAPENDFTRRLSGELRRHNTFILIEAILRQQARQHPLLILLEDIQWSDELSLSLTEYLVRHMAQTSVFFGLIYRPPGDKVALKKLQNLSQAYTMYLEPLDRQESLDLIRILAGDQPLSAEVEEIILSKTHGNPFFIQEITGATLNAITNQRQQTTNLLEPLNLPNSIEDVILARIDKLSEAEKLTLKIASVIGASFQRLLLSTVHPMDNAQYHLPAQLARLEHEQMLRLEAPAPKWEYVFRNVIAQEVIYEGLLLNQRRQLHSVVAEALETLAPEEIEQLAFHYRRANCWDKALKYLEMASKRAQREHANYAAIGHYSEMLNCLENLAAENDGSIIDPKYWDVLLERAKLYHLVGWRDEELEDLGTLGIMAEALDDDERRALSARQWAYLYETSGDYASGLELLERCIELARQAGDYKLLSQSYNHRSKLLYLQSEYGLAITYSEKALVIAQSRQDQAVKADSLHNQGLIAYYQARYSAARDAFQESIQLWQNAENQIEVGNNLSHLGQVYYDIGQYSEAEACYRQALTLHAALGNRPGEALARHGLGRIARSLGDYALAQSQLEQALNFYHSVGNRHHEAYILSDLGFLRLRQARYNSALNLLEESLSIMEDLDAPWWAKVKALIYYSWALAEDNQLDRAREENTEALEIERDTQQKITTVEDIGLLGHIALAQNDSDTAVACARQMLHFIQYQGNQGIEHPAMIYLTCYRILKENQEYARAVEVLIQGHRYVTSQAAAISDPQAGRRYLGAIPENRTLQSLVERVASVPS